MRNKSCTIVVIVHRNLCPKITYLTTKILSKTKHAPKEADDHCLVVWLPCFPVLYKMMRILDIKQPELTFAHISCKFIFRYLQQINMSGIRGDWG